MLVIFIILIIVYLTMKCILLYKSKIKSKQDFDVYEKAANEGFIEAQYILGTLYYDGKIVEQDYKKAIFWFKKAGNKGHRRSQYILGFIFHNGEGIDRDYKKAIKWYKKAANQGDIKAQYTLEIMFCNGEEVNQDKIVAKE